MNLAERDTALRELMDDPDCDPDALAATLERFDLVNRAIGGWGRVWRRGIRPRLQRLGRPTRVLDVGSGGGDVVARLATWAERDGLDVEWLGIDPDPRALEVARTRESARVSFAATDAAGLRAAGETFDLVLSNHVLHHLEAAELAEFAADTRALATGTVMHADIERGRLAYALYGIGITALERGTFLRTDGLRSIRRSYRAEELESALDSPWRVASPAPFRLLAVADGDA